MSRSKTKIFDNEAAELLAVVFKRNKSAETFSKLAELMDQLIQSILKSEQFPDWQDVYNFLFLQMERWIDRWVPGKGHLYAYISASTKNAAVSYTTKAALYRQKVMGTDVPLEELGGVDEDSHTALYRGDHMGSIKRELLSIETRWSEPEVRAALRYCFLAILEGKCRTSPNRNQLLKYLTMVDVSRPDGTSYTLSRDQARHLLDYAQGAVRSVFLNVRLESVSLTETDLFRLRYQFSKFADIESVVGTEAAQRLLTHFAGQTIKFPSIKVCNEVKRQVASFNTMASENDDSDHDESIYRDGEAHDESVYRGAMSVRGVMVGERLGSHPLFTSEHEEMVESVLETYGDGE